jgi:LPXTG-motif cell wall-anchored protein
VATLSQLGGDIDGEAANDQSGRPIAMSADGTRIAVGAPFNDGAGNNAGQVRVFAWNGTTWVQTGGDINGEAADDFSGSSVAMSADGTRIVVGAVANDDGGNSAGHVRVFAWNGTAWAQTGGDIDGVAAGDQVNSVAMSADGTRIAVGAPGNDDAGNNAGQVRVFAWNGTAWVQTGGDINGEAADDESGNSVAMSADGSRIAVGAHGNDGGGNNVGQVRVYTWNGTTWVQTGGDIDGEAANDQSGSSVAMSADGTLIAVGAITNDGAASDAGHVRVYTWNGSAWNQTGGDIDGEATNDYSGWSVAMSADGTRITVGAPFNDGSGPNAGQVRVFAWNGTTWVQTGGDIDGEATGDESGLSVAMSADGTRFAVGATTNDGAAGDAGHVRVYELPSVPAAPTLTSVTAAIDSLDVSFTPGFDGRSPITNYKYSLDGINYITLNPSVTSSPFTISGLTPGTSYSITIKAVNSVGESPASAALTATPSAPATTVAPATTIAPGSLPATTVAPGSLPATGNGSTGVVMIGFFLMILGLILIGRRDTSRNGSVS